MEGIPEEQPFAGETVRLRQVEVGYITDPERRSLECCFQSAACRVIGGSAFRRRASLGFGTSGPVLDGRSLLR